MKNKTNIKYLKYATNLLSICMWLNISMVITFIYLIVSTNLTDNTLVYVLIMLLNLFAAINSYSTVRKNKIIIQNLNIED